jgi:hypothetical protein
VPVLSGKAYARGSNRREIVASLGRAGDIERSSGVERVCRTNQLGGFARGKAFFSVKAQAVREMCIYEQDGHI